MKFTNIALAVAMLGAGGCASSELTQQKMAQTRASIDAAKELDAEENPDVALHLRYANDQLTVARQLLQEGEEDAAQRMLDRARSDAQLAIALARTDRSRKEAEQAWREVEGLRNGSSNISQ